MRFLSVLCCLLVGMPQICHAEIQHIVLLWLKPDTTLTAKQTIIEQSNALQTLPEVESVKVGNALQSDRSIVDDSFTLAVIFQFKDELALKAFEQNPVHLNFVKNHVKPNLDKILIYDVVY